MRFLCCHWQPYFWSLLGQYWCFAMFTKKDSRARTLRMLLQKRGWAPIIFFCKHGGAAICQEGFGQKSIKNNLVIDRIIFPLLFGDFFSAILWIYTEISSLTFKKGVGPYNIFLQTWRGCNLSRRFRSKIIKNKVVINPIIFLLLFNDFSPQ